MLDDVLPEYDKVIDFYECNIDKASSLAALYKVKSIPHLTIIRKTGHAEALVGSKTKDQLKYHFEGLLSD